jgi:hypothetical protein
VAIEFVVLTVRDGRCTLHPNLLGTAHLEIGTASTLSAMSQLTAQGWRPCRAEVKDGIEVTVLERDVVL